MCRTKNIKLKKTHGRRNNFSFEGVLVEGRQVLRTFRGIRAIFKTVFLLSMFFLNLKYLMRNAVITT